MLCQKYSQVLLLEDKSELRLFSWHFVKPKKCDNELNETLQPDGDKMFL